MRAKTRRSDTSKKKKKIARPLLAKFACGQVSSPRLYRLTSTGRKALLNTILITQNVTTRKFITLKNFWPKTRKIDAFNFYWLKTIVNVTIFLKKGYFNLSNQIENFSLSFHLVNAFLPEKKTHIRCGQWIFLFQNDELNLIEKIPYRRTSESKKWIFIQRTHKYITLIYSRF